MGSIAGPVIGAVGSVFGAKKGNDAAEDRLDKQLEFNREVMQNRHQWEVEDLKNAGLNPMLSANGATGTLSAPGTLSFAPDVAGGIRAGAEAAQTSAQKKVLQSQSALNIANADAASTNADANTINAQANLINAENAHATGVVQRGLLQAQTDFQNITNKYQEALNAVGLDRAKQDLIYAQLEAQARIEMLNAQGAAALTTASAASENAASQRIIAEVAAENGVSERELKKVMSDKGRIETDEALARLRVYAEEHPHELNPSIISGPLNRISESLQKLNPIKGLFSITNGQ